MGTINFRDNITISSLYTLPTQINLNLNHTLSFMENKDNVNFIFIWGQLLCVKRFRRGILIH